MIRFLIIVNLQIQFQRKLNYKKKKKKYNQFSNLAR